MRTDPNMIGRVIDMQWWIADPNAINGLAKSRVAQLTVF